MFCLLYDDDRWTCKSVENSPAKVVESKSSANNTPSFVFNVIEFGVLSKEQLEGMDKFSEDGDFLRLLAEINFIYAEVFDTYLNDLTKHVSFCKNYFKACLFIRKNCITN